MSAALNVPALSPRSANVVVKPKTKETERKAQRRMDPAHSHLPSPPPPIVTEPGDEQEQYVTGAFLGKGGFAMCYKGTLERNRKVFAMKVVKSDMKKKMQDKVSIIIHGSWFCLDQVYPDFACSSNPNFKSTLKCATRISYSSTAPSPLTAASTLSWKCVRMDQ